MLYAAAMSSGGDDDWVWHARIGFWRLGEAEGRRVIELKSPEGHPSRLAAEDLRALLETLEAPSGEA